MLEPAVDPYIPVVIQEHLFRHDVKKVRSKPGQRLTEILREHDLNPDEIHARVLIDDQLVEEAYWSRVTPKPGHLVTIRVIPQGGGGDTGKNVLRVVAMVGVLALAIAAPYIAAGLFPAIAGLVGPMSIGAPLLSAAVMFGASLRINAVLTSPHSPHLLRGTRDA